MVLIEPVLTPTSYDGTPTAETLSGLGPSLPQRIQTSIQDGLTYRVVWAADAVRVQAIAMSHSRIAELGEGPALALTHGVDCLPAALLCLLGLASRTAARWAIQKNGSDIYRF
jgi:hypothetical protein